MIVAEQRGRRSRRYKCLNLHGVFGDRSRRVQGIRAWLGQEGFIKSVMVGKGSTSRERIALEARKRIVLEACERIVLEACERIAGGLGDRRRFCGREGRCFGGGGSSGGFWKWRRFGWEGRGRGKTQRRWLGRGGLVCRSSVAACGQGRPRNAGHGSIQRFEFVFAFKQSFGERGEFVSKAVKFGATQ